MRVLHTADWHLGKRLDFYSRYDEQKAVLEEICSIAKEQSVDLVLVAGDIFDTYNPPNEAAELLYTTLKKLACDGRVPVIAIAGNHDSPDRISVADILARENGIILIGRPDEVVPLSEPEDGIKITATAAGFFEIRLPQFSYPVRLIHTAFANEIRLKEYFGEDKQQALQESLRNRWGDMAGRYCDVEGVNLLITHLYMMERGGDNIEEPEGEKPLNIGNADVIYSDAVPEKIQYAALGHLHSFQDVGIHQPVIYSSSPLAYSFSEAGQQKYIVIADIEPGKKAVFQKIPLHYGKPLVRKRFDDVDKAIGWLSSNKNSLVELTMATDEFLTADERRRISESHDGIIRLIPIVKNTGAVNTGLVMVDLSQDMDQLFNDYFMSKNDDQKPNSEMMDLFREILNS